MFLFYIDDNYDEKASAFYKEYKVKLPVKGLTYTIRKVELVNGHYVLLLNEIFNSQVVINKIPKGEPGFHYARFTNVPNNVLEWEEVDKIYKEQQKQWQPPK